MQKTCHQQQHCSGRINTSPNSSTAELYQHRASVPFCGNDRPKYYTTAPDDASNIDPYDKAISEFLTVNNVESEQNEIDQSGKY